MLPFENETIEYKREVTDSIKKEVLAFINTTGGSIYIGVSDDGKVVGMTNPDEAMLQVGNMLRDGVHPDAMMFVQIHAEMIEDKTVLHIKVSEGSNKPYYLKKYGLKPSGVYVRQGSASVQASPERIRQMIKAADGDVFEDNVSLNQELTFQKTAQVFATHNLSFGPQQLQTLGLVRKDGVFTNLALILSDQCPYTIKAAAFQGKDQTLFKDRREFSGPLLAQLEECYAYLQLNNPVSAAFQGLYRVDQKAYPDVAVREALLNCLVHRDYGFSASTFVSLYENRLEFTSLGGLLPGFAKEDILLGLSVCRNKKLAEVFYRLELIEAYGTGLLKIQNAYKDSSDKPELLTSPNAFKVILPRLQAREQAEGKPLFQTKEELVLEYLSKREAATRKDVQDLLHISQATAVRMMKNMTEENLLIKEGRGKGIRYRKNPDKNVAKSPSLR